MPIAVVDWRLVQTVTGAQPPAGLQQLKTLTKKPENHWYLAYFIHSRPVGTQGGMNSFLRIYLCIFKVTFKTSGSFELADIHQY